MFILKSICAVAMARFDRRKGYRKAMSLLSQGYKPESIRWGFADESAAFCEGIDQAIQEAAL